MMETKTKHPEEWQTVPGFPDYKISSLGRVLSFKGGKEKFLKPTKYERTYTVSLFNARGRKNFDLHRLVLLVFRPIPNVKAYIAAPKDGDPFNVHLDNLEWRRQCGSNHPTSKLTEAQVIEMRQLYKEDHTQTHASLAKRYGIGQSTVGPVLNGETWSHVDEERELVK
jgi:hypothetical protein